MGNDFNIFNSNNQAVKNTPNLLSSWKDEATNQKDINEDGSDIDYAVPV